MRVIYTLFTGISLIVSHNLCFAQNSSIVSVDTNGKLTYTPDSDGNTLPDFSMVGYHNGEKTLPTVPVKLTLNPTSGDRFSDIQNAIDLVAAMTPDANGHRGAILLKQGNYEVSGTLIINESGIVIRGEGEDSNGTVLKLTATSKVNLFEIGGIENAIKDSTTMKSIVGYVPVGEKTVTVETGHTFQTGDRVYLSSGLTASYLTSLGMDDLSSCGLTNWEAPYDSKYKRIVTDVDGNDITLDAPVVDPISDSNNQAVLMKYTWLDKIEECGIEHIRLESSYASETDENHGWDAIELTNIENAWVKNVKSYFFGYACVNLNSGSYKVTVQDCGMYDYKSQITGGRRYGFTMDGADLCLVRDCETTEGRHDFATSSKVPGPNVFYNVIANATHSDAGPHHRWTTGTLYDNLTTDTELRVQNRKCAGSGHGWAGAQQVLWNCVADNIVLHDPPAEQLNWAIGCTGSITNVGQWATEPLGFVESQNTPIVDIKSLYIAQLTDRLGPTAPSTLSSDNTTEGQVDLTWIDNSSNETSFAVERQENGTWTKLATINANSTTYSDTNLGSNYSYSYRVCAMYETANSVPSNEVVVNMSSSNSIIAIADSYIRGDEYANDNFGSNELVIKDAGSDRVIREVFIKFDLASLPSNISSANLKLTVGDADVNTFEAFLVSNDNWTESGITWNNAPFTASSLGSKSNSSSSVLEWDISTELLAELSGDEMLTVKVIGKVNNIHSIIESKESASSETEKPAITFETIPEVIIAPAEFTEIVASDDAVVRRKNYVDVNYGTGALNLKQGSTDDNNVTRRAILKFDLSSISGLVTDATIRLTSSNNSANSYETYFVANDNWSESSVTYNNMPSSSLQMGSVISVSSSNPDLEIDVTAQVLTEIAGDGILTVYIKSSDVGVSSKFFDQDHATASNRPTLIINDSNSGARIMVEEVVEESLALDYVVFPNPAKERLFVENLSHEAEVTIFSGVGRLILSTKYKEGIYLSDVNPGIYILRIQDKLGFYTTKFIKE